MCNAYICPINYKPATVLEINMAKTFKEFAMAVLREAGVEVTK